MYYVSTMNPHASKHCLPQALCRNIFCCNMNLYKATLMLRQALVIISWKVGKFAIVKWLHLQRRENIKDKEHDA